MEEIYGVADAVDNVKFVWADGATVAQMTRDATRNGEAALGEAPTIVQRCSTTLSFTTSLPEGKTVADYSVSEGAIILTP